MLKLVLISVCLFLLSACGNNKVYLVHDDESDLSFSDIEQRAENKASEEEIKAADAIIAVLTEQKITSKQSQTDQVEKERKLAIQKSDTKTEKKATNHDDIDIIKISSEEVIDAEKATNNTNIDEKLQNRSIILSEISDNDAFIIDSATDQEDTKNDDSGSFISNVLTMVDRVIGIASSYLGEPYRWGGNSPEKGFDCSGLVQYSFSWADVDLPRTAAEQYKYATPVPLKDILPGDILFFKTNRRSRRKVTHNGIYVGDRRFIHAPSTGKTIRYASLDKNYWKKRIVGAGRIERVINNVPCATDSELIEIIPVKK